MEASGPSGGGQETGVGGREAGVRGRESGVGGHAGVSATTALAKKKAQGPRLLAEIERQQAVLAELPEN
jgi:hypothetical protein